MKLSCLAAVLAIGMSVGIAFCAETVIGVASTRGIMEVNSASVRGNANVADGASIRTNDTAGQVQLNNGVQVTLGEHSSASIHADRVQLLQGGAQVAAKTGFGVEALGFHVAPGRSAAVARVAFENSNRILVSAMDAPVTVSKEGVLLARLNPGTTYFFEPDDPQDQSASAAGKKSSGNPKKAAKAGLSNGAKWGIAAGVAAAGLGVGLGVGLSGGDTSH